MHITVLSAGPEGARLVRALRPHATRLTTIVGTSADAWLYGLRVCPDLDVTLHALGDDGRRGSHAVQDELTAYAVPPTWARIDDASVAAAIVRTQMLQAGYPLSHVTAALARRHGLGDDVEVLPVTDDRVELHVGVDAPDAEGGRAAVHVQEYAACHTDAPVHQVVAMGSSSATPIAAATEAVRDSARVVLAPADPVAGLGPVLDVPGVRESLRATQARVVGVSPVVGGRPLDGTLPGLWAAVGLEATAAAVAAHYGRRSEGGVLDAWVTPEAPYDPEATAGTILATDPS